MSVYVLPSVFSVLLIICGFMAWKMPLPYSERESGHWPHYSGKLAYSSKELWDKAQIIFWKDSISFWDYTHFYRVSGSDAVKTNTTKLAKGRCNIAGDVVSYSSRHCYGNSR